MQLIFRMKRSEEHVAFLITRRHVFLRKRVKINEKRQVNIFSSLSTIIKVVTCIFSYFFEQMMETGNLGAREVQSKLGVKYINPICITRARSCRVLLYLMSTMFSFGMQMRICHGKVIEPVSVVTIEG